MPSECAGCRLSLYTVILRTTTTATPTGGPLRLREQATRPPARPGLHTHHTDTARPHARPTQHDDFCCHDDCLLAARASAPGRLSLKQVNRQMPSVPPERRCTSPAGRPPVRVSAHASIAADQISAATACREQRRRRDDGRASRVSIMPLAASAAKVAHCAVGKKTRFQRLGCPVRQLQDNGAQFYQCFFRSYEGAAPETYAEPSGVVGLP